MLASLKCFVDSPLVITHVYYICASSRADSEGLMLASLKCFVDSPLVITQVYYICPSSRADTNAGIT